MSKTKGVTLVELMITVTIIMLGLIPLLNMFIRATRGTQFMGSSTVADNLAEQMLAEISQKKWDEKCAAPGVYTDTPTVKANLGPDTSTYGPTPGIYENSTDKTTFDDVDDYKGWSEQPPQNLKGEPISEYVSYKISVDVTYVTDPVSGAITDAGSATDFKKVEVTVEWKSASTLSANKITRYRIFYNGVKYD
ncbi:MAG: prepilin-type N-terminal cleavage/methylation domain-containing protein [Elusimicrobia bacterium]|nr:prepilin-type N-terminal cleavage/methylation domain-containing protein [Elusimicrobiota bacterium]